MVQVVRDGWDSRERSLQLDAAECERSVKRPGLESHPRLGRRGTTERVGGHWGATSMTECDPPRPQQLSTGSYRAERAEYAPVVSVRRSAPAATASSVASYWRLTGQKYSRTAPMASRRYVSSVGRAH